MFLVMYKRDDNHFKKGLTRCGLGKVFCILKSMYHLEKVLSYIRL